jgi:dGTPase
VPVGSAEPIRLQCASLTSIMGTYRTVRRGMDWEQLLSAERFRAPAATGSQRSPFQRDFDRIVFSAAFRRLQDKTQVHPFPESDYVRRRLTHSLEVSCVGRSLGAEVGNNLAAHDSSLLQLDSAFPFTIGQIVANACLAHDIGNPPFGHAGEKAIGSWFKERLPATLATELTPVQRTDLNQFEGNAQGFRLLTRLQEARDAGGLGLTYATLAAFTKYPTSALNAGCKQYVGARKHGFFEDDRDSFSQIASATGLIQYEKGWKRHPLAFLVEAADDICYRIIDVEDAFKLDRLSFKDAEELLFAILPSESYYRQKDNETGNISWLRAKAIAVLIEQVEKAFSDHLPDIKSGAFSDPLIEKVTAHSAVEAAHSVVVRRVFAWDRTVSAEIAGVQMITDILERLVSALEAPTLYRSGLLLKIVPRYNNNMPTYARILCITDFVAGMTDTYLQRIHRRVTGQAIH